MVGAGAIERLTKPTEQADEAVPGCVHARDAPSNGKVLYQSGFVLAASCFAFSFARHLFVAWKAAICGDIAVLDGLNRLTGHAAILGSDL